MPLLAEYWDFVMDDDKADINVLDDLFLQLRSSSDV